MEQNQPTLSVVLPVYNDAPSLKVFLPELFSFLADLPGRQEVIVVDDGSANDQVKAVFDHYVVNLPENMVMRLIRLSRNFGKEAALSAGLDNASGAAVATMDSDGQHPVSVLAEMWALYLSGMDMVAAVQSSRHHEGKLLRCLKNGFYHFMQDTHRYEIKPNAGDFRIMSAKVVAALRTLPERQRFMKGLYAWVGFKTAYVPFVASVRSEGRSTFNYPRLFELAMVGITSFSQKPLRWISRMGMVVSLCSILYGLYVVVGTLLFGIDVPGWPTVTAGIMFSAGVQLICLGVIGEYIGRIYEEVKQRPLFIVDKIWDSRDL